MDNVLSQIKYLQCYINIVNNNIYTNYEVCYLLSLLFFTDKMLGHAG